MTIQSPQSQRPAVTSALTSLENILDRYDAIFCDIWGVVHNGVEPYPTAVAALQEARKRGIQVVLVTNAPSANARIASQLARMGIDGSTYDAIMSSGEVTRALMAPYRGRVVHHVGRVGDDHLFAGLDLTRGPAETAACVIVTELPGAGGVPEDYIPQMRIWRDHDLPFICVNPDKLVEEAGRLIYCPGAIADIYEQMGGQVIQAGKPHAAIYQAAFNALHPTASGPIKPDRVLAVGDSLRTDATGAAGQGIDFLFITGSLHAEELDAFGAPDVDKIAASVVETGARLVGFQARLQ